MPTLESVEIGPTERYYGGTPVITSQKSFSYDEIKTMPFSEGGRLSSTYQLSKDGSTYYWML